MMTSPLLAREVPTGIIPVDKLQGESNKVTGPNTTTIPTPTGGNIGDWQFVIFNHFTNDTPVWTGSDFGLGDGQWRMPIWSASSTSTNHNVMFRKLTASNINTPFAASQVSGALQFHYCTFILRGINEDDPVLGSSLSGDSIAGTTSTNNTHETRYHCWAPGQVPLANPDEDLILAITSTGNGTPYLMVPDEGGDILFTHVNLFTGNTGNHAYVLQRGGSEYEDLNGDGHPLDGWTAVNCTTSTVPSNIAQAFTLQEMAAGTTRYGMYKDFTLEAGKEYMFVFDSGQVGNVSSGSGETATYLGFIDTNGVEHGYAGNESVNTSGGLIGTALTADDYWRHPDYSNNGFGGFRYATTLRIRPLVTGVHRLWVSFITSGQVPTIGTSLYARTGSTSRFFRGSYIRVIERLHPYEMPGGYRRRNNSSYRDVTWTRRLLGPKVNLTSGSSSQRRTDFVTIRAPGGTRPIVQMGGGVATHHISQSPSPNRTIGNFEQYPWPAQAHHYEYSDQAVGPWNSADRRFYFEVKLDSMYASQWFGIKAASCTDLEFQSSLFSTGSSAFTHFYVAASAQKNQAGTITGALPAWFTNDVIGFLLDLNTGVRLLTITRNGAAWSTMALSSDARAMTWMFKILLTRSVDGSSGDVSRYTLNLRGPFLYKPASCVAFDFDNEVA